jgi:hypothetical protein
MFALGAKALGGLPTVTDTDQLFAASPPLPSGASGVIGVAFGDFNNDGYPDLFLVPNIYPQGGRLYTNNRDGTFTLSTVGAMASNVSGFGAAWADYTNSGNISLIVGQATSDYLYLGDGTASFAQEFANVSANYGSQFYPAWADYDGDGLVDLFVANGFGSNYGVAGENTLFHNAGNGSFTPVTKGALVTDVPSFSNCAVWADFDNDGLPDLFVANGRDLKTNALQLSFLYHNLGNGNFEKITTGPLATTPAGLNSAALADYDNDGNLDLFTCGEGTGSAPQKRTLWHNDGKGNFSEATNAGPIDSDADIDESCAWEDYDNDGFIDLVVTSGGSFGARYASLYHNNGDGTFTRLTLGALVNTPGDGGGLAWADVNNDGFPDLFVGNFQQTTSNPNVLYINKSNSNNWLTFTCVGTSSNRAAIGAKVHVHATIGGKAIWQLRVIGTGAGYASQNELRAHFGLGDATVADVVRVEWPSGIVQTMANVTAKQFLTLTEPSTTVPVFTTEPISVSISSGAVALDAMASGGASYQWFLNGSTPVVGATNATLLIPDASSAAGVYTCVATTAGGSATSSPATIFLTPTADIGRLVNISARAQVGTGAGLLVAGFAVGGTGTTGSQNILVRASGPAIAVPPFNVVGTLSDPQLQLFDRSGTVLDTDDAWGGEARYRLLQRRSELSYGEIQRATTRHFSCPWLLGPIRPRLPGSPEIRGSHSLKSMTPPLLAPIRRPFRGLSTFPLVSRLVPAQARFLPDS